MLRLVKALALAALVAAPAVAQSPGIRHTPADGLSSYTNDGYAIAAVVSRGLITQPSNVTLTGPCPGLFAFDYSFTYNGQRQNIPFRATLTAADCQLPLAVQQMKVLSAFQQQFASNQTIRDAIGADIVDYSYVRREPGQGKPYQFQFFQSVPFWQSGANPVLTPVSGVDVAIGNDTLEIDPFMSFVRSTLDKGRPPKAGDLIGGIYFTGDVLARPDIGAPARAADTRNVDPMYGSILVEIVDPTYGKSRITFTFDEVVWQDTHGNKLGVTKTCSPGSPLEVKNGLIVGC